MPIESEDSGECLFELLVGQSVAEGVDWTVHVTQPVGDVVDEVEVEGRKQHHQNRNDVPRCPTDQKGSQDHRDGSEGLASSVFPLVCLPFGYIATEKNLLFVFVETRKL